MAPPPPDQRPPRARRSAAARDAAQVAALRLRERDATYRMAIRNTVPDPPPGLVARGALLALVRYTAPVRGAMSVRGKTTGWRYPYSADRPRFWVDADDLRQFADHVDFAVEADRIDPAATAIQRLVTQQQAPLVAELRHAHEAIATLRQEIVVSGVQRRAQTPRRPGPGRKSIPRQRYLDWHHLRHHAGIATQDLARLYVGPESQDPPGTMSGRLYRAKTILTPVERATETCLHCLNGWLPDVSDLRPDPI